MKIRSIALNQFKKFTSPIRLGGISDGLNVLVGPNEMGKSTLLDALRAALFERYSSKAQAITALQNDRNQAAPVVELEFELDQGQYRIRKRFIKKPYAQLFCPDGRKLEGDAAEELLRELLGFEEPGKAGAKPENLGMWNVLWVQQGQSFGVLELPDSARSNLHNALEAEVGEILGGRRGRALPDSVEKQLRGMVTGTGKPRGDYKELIARVEALRSDLEDIKTRRRELSATLDELETTQESLERAQSEDRDQSYLEDLNQARTRYGELVKLESHIETAATEVKLQERNVDQARSTLSERKQLKQRIEDERTAVDIAGKRLNDVQIQETDVRSKLDALRRQVREADTVIKNADELASRARRLSTTAHRNSSIRELQARLENTKEADKRQRAAQQAAAVILVTEDNLKRLQKASKELEVTTSRLSAAATRISFDVPGDRLSTTKVNGAPLSDDRTSFEAIETVAIEIPNYGHITVEPAIEDRDHLLEQQRSARASLREALEDAGAASLDLAQEQLIKRRELLREADFARKEVELHAPATDDHDAGARALADHIEALKAVLEREMDEFGVQETPTPQAADVALHDAQHRAQESREALATARAALEQPEKEYLRLQGELGVVKTRYDDGKARLQRLQSELSNTEAQSTEKDLRDAVNAAETALNNQNSVVTELEQQRTGETLPQLEARILRLEKSIRDRRDKRTSQKEKIAGLRSHVEVLEGAGIDEAIEEKSRELELSADQLYRSEREIKILALLLSTLRAAETDAKQRYLSPILKRVQPYLQLLFPGAEISIDENLHIVGVIREAGYEEQFHHLSIGTQEQIAVLIRLAFAEMLTEQGHPATVILDDALVFSDDRRMDRMFDILNMVSQHVQIIVLTCREQLFEGIGGHHLSLKPADAEELTSA